MAYFKIRFINGDGPISRGIDWWTNSLWDHVEIETEKGTWIGAHASGGIQERAADYCQPTREARYSIPCADVQLDRIMAFARSKIGTPYDFKDIVGLLFHARINSNKGSICSEFVFGAALGGGLKMLNVLPQYAYLITPETLHLSPLLIGHCTCEHGV